MPAPIIRNIPGLEKRIVGLIKNISSPTGFGWGTVDQNITKNLPEGVGSLQIGHDFKISTNGKQNLQKLFDGNSATSITIKHNHPASGPVNMKNWIVFDLGKQRKLDRTTITNAADNSAVNAGVMTRWYFWTKDQNPQTDIATAYSDLGSLSHNSTTKTTDDLSNLKYVSDDSTYSDTSFQYVAFRLEPEANFNNSGHLIYDNIEIYESFDTRDYSVEFNDSVLDMQSWAGPRYKGCKTTGKKINEYHPSSSTYSGDITFGKSPNVENKTTALYITHTIIGGTEEEDIYARIKNHSYVGIDTILIINLNDDTVKILNKETSDFTPYHRFITSDFPTGGKFTLKVLDNAIESTVKNEYNVKMNKGWLLKSFSYNSTDGPLPGIDEDGTELPGQNLNAQDSNVSYTVANPLSLYDAVSGSVQFPDRIYGFNEQLENGLYGCTDNTEPCTGAAADIATSISDLRNVFSFGPLYGTIDSNALVSVTPRNPGNEIYDSTYTQHEGGSLKFRFGVTERIDNKSPATGHRASFYPLYTGDNTKFTDNKFTRQFINQDNNSQIAVKNFDFPTIQDIKNTQANLTFGGTDGILKSNTLNPSVTASVFIGQCVQFLNNNAQDTDDKLGTELHLTLFEGTKDFSGKNDELSISTFEVDRNVNSGYLDFADNEGKLYNTIGPRAKYLKLKNSPQFKPSIPLPERGDNRFVYDLIETSDYQTVIEERQNSFVFGPGTPHTDLHPYSGRIHVNSVNTIASNYDNSPLNSDNFSGSFQYELSFLDKDHTLIADIDKNSELSNGIGIMGAVLIPEHTHRAVKANLLYYLEKAGIGNRTTKKKIIDPS
tara:strand:+ start:6569 stop:9061 length:2493 start_codon:yes stop_codon:yes gene_type:complete